MSRIDRGPDPSTGIMCANCRAICDRAEAAEARAVDAEALAEQRGMVIDRLRGEVDRYRKALEGMAAMVRKLPARSPSTWSLITSDRWLLGWIADAIAAHVAEVLR